MRAHPGLLANSLLYALAWASFALSHSGLATLRGRRWLARLFGAADRLAYNLIALLHLALVLGAGAVLFRPYPPFLLSPPLAWGMGGMAAGGLVLLLLAGRAYDPARFFGLRQLTLGRAEAELAPEPLHIGGLNRLVRHPLYLGLLLLVWGLARTPFLLATAVAVSLYLAIGIPLEERKLRRLYGAAYARYAAAVPALFPRLLRKAEPPLSHPPAG
jgi:protein-S-isoprenylcysteine O-methyltransferase Ste14